MSGDAQGVRWAVRETVNPLNGFPVPARVGVLGGGRMGAGIAHAFLLAGAHVTVAEADEQQGDAAREKVGRSVLRSVHDVGAQAWGGVEDVMARLDVGVGIEVLAGADLVVEAVPEDAALKSRVLAGLDALLAPGAVLATNTSSIGIGELGAALGGRAFLGLHFFNPVPTSTMIEVVVGPATPPDLVERVRDWAAAMLKTPVVVADSPGFATSRLGLALGLEAIRTVESGVASVEDVDRAMTLGYEHAVGPLATTDVVGLDVRLGIAEHLARRLGPRFEPPSLLREMVAAGFLGRKSGVGFYTHGGAGEVARTNPTRLLPENRTGTEGQR